MRNSPKHVWMRQEDAWGDYFKMMGVGGNLVTLVSATDWWLQSRADKPHQHRQWSLCKLQFLLPFYTSKFMQMTFTSRPPTFGSPRLLVTPSLPSLTFSSAPHPYNLSPTTHYPSSLTWVELLYWNNIKSELIHFSQILILKFQTYWKV